MTTTIKAQKDLYNQGKCFTKGRTYEVIESKNVSNEAGLMDLHTTNDLGERHQIGAWWREFKIID